MSNAKPNKSPRGVKTKSVKTRAVKARNRISSSTARQKNTHSKPSMGRRILSWCWRLSLIFILALGTWMVFLDAEIRAQFDGNKWTLPGKLFARPLSLYPGLLLSESQLKSELNWNDYQPVTHVTHPGTYGRLGDDWLIYRRAFGFTDQAEPAVKIRLSFKDGRINKLSIGDEDGALIRLDPQYIGGIFPAHHEDRELIRLDQVPPELVAALVAVEDRGFFQHYGISVRGILRAMQANIAAGRTVQGGSTLTQQLVKNFFLTNERSLQRKIKEAFMALLLEYHYSKEDILQAYLNEVYLGQSGRRSVHGIALASRFYFAKDIQQLSLSEIALLVGMVKGPSYYNPLRHPQRARARRDVVLNVMDELNIISQAERIQAQGESVRVASSSRAGQREYPAFIQLVKKQLQQDYRLKDLQNEGLRVFTTLDPWLQHSSEKSIKSHLENLERRFNLNKPTLESAAIVTSVDGGEVRAMVGSRRVQFFGFNRALFAKRSIGSLAKPAVYLTALNSKKYDWSSVIDDKAVSIGGQDGSLWQPRNYDRQDHGRMFMVDAMAKSLNQATVRLGMKVGLGNVVKTLKKLGAGDTIAPYPSIVLGSFALSPLQVTQMFQTYASGGFFMIPRAIQGVTTLDGRTLTSYAASGQQVFSAEQIEALRFGMQQVVVQGTAKRLGRRFGTTKIAAKTGTSDEQRDAWFAGFDDRHLGVIWVGRDDNQPMPITGASGALPIWQGIFDKVGVEPLTPLAPLQWAWVNELGQGVSPSCDGARKMPFLTGRLPVTKVSCDSRLPRQNQGSSRSGNYKEKEKDKEEGSWLDWLF